MESSQQRTSSPHDTPPSGNGSVMSRRRNMLPTTSDSSGSAQAIHISNDGSSSSRRSRTRRASERDSELPMGEKIGIHLNTENQPETPAWAVIKLSNEAASLARRDLKVIYRDFRDIPRADYEGIIEILNGSFVFANMGGGVDCDYVRAKINDAWKRKKSYLKRRYVDGKDPDEVKAMTPSDKVPVEDWRVFVDNCNTDTMKALSEQNRENRMMQNLPNCGGRTPAQLVRYRIAQELGIDVSLVGRGYTYLAMHTHADDTPQDAVVAGLIKDSMLKNPDSQNSVDDAVADLLAQTVGVDTGQGVLVFVRQLLRRVHRIRRGKRMKQANLKNGRKR